VKWRPAARSLAANCTSIRHQQRVKGDLSIMGKKRRVCSINLRTGRASQSQDISGKAGRLLFLHGQNVGRMQTPVVPAHEMDVLTASNWGVLSNMAVTEHDLLPQLYIRQARAGARAGFSIFSYAENRMEEDIRDRESPVFVFDGNTFRDRHYKIPIAIQKRAEFIWPFRPVGRRGHIFARARRASPRTGKIFFGRGDE